MKITLFIRENTKTPLDNKELWEERFSLALKNAQKLRNACENMKNKVYDDINTISQIRNVTQNNYFQNNF